MMQFTSDPSVFNKIANDPVISRWVKQDGEPDVDLTALFASGDAFAIGDDAGGFVFHAKGPGIYEVHTLIDRHAGRASTKAREAAAMMFLRSDCTELWTRVPALNTPAKSLTEHIGFTLEFEQVNAWRVLGELCDVLVYSLGITDWLRGRDIGDCAADMIGAGYPAKAAQYYNRRAIAAGDPLMSQEGVLCQ